MRRIDTPPAWDERSTLITMLDYARATVHAKCEGISEENARNAPLPRSLLMTIAGMVNHLRWVEYSWIQVVFLGEENEGPWTDDDPDREMRNGGGVRNRAAARGVRGPVCALPRTRRRDLPRHTG